MPGDQPLLEITVGRESFRFGEIALTVFGDGRADVLQRRSGEVREWHGRAAHEEVAALSGVDVGSLPHTPGPLDPDDEPVVVRAGGHEAALRHADRYEDVRVDALLAHWQAVTEEVTDGALPFGTSMA